MLDAVRIQLFHHCGRVRGIDGGYPGIQCGGCGRRKEKIDLGEVSNLPNPDDANASIDKTSYKITTPDELMYLVKWTNTGKKTFAGVTLYLAPENGTLNMSGKDFAPMNVVNGSEFKGTLDGLGNTIDHLTVTNQAASGAVLVGLFARVKGGTVRNLILGENCSFTYAGTSNNANKGIGSIAALADGITVENVCSYAKVSFNEDATLNPSPDAVCVAGLVGWFRTSPVAFDRTTYAGTVRFTQNNTATHKNHEQIGGFVGGCVGTATSLTITNSVNQGNIDADGKAVGGFVGETSKTTCTFRNLLNEGSVTAEKTEVGGIIGCVPSQSSVTVENCVNRGTVASKVMGTIGGIVGIIEATGVSITGCTNFGFINAQQDPGADRPLGGIVGKIATTGSATVSNCTNYGKVGSAVIGERLAGGIVGSETADGTTVNACKNYGVVYGKAPEAPMAQWVGYQLTDQKEIDGKFYQSIRFVGSIDSTKYSEVGFYITVKDGNGAVVKKTSTFACHHVYTEMYAMGNEGNIFASDYRAGGYLFGSAIYEIPVGETYTFEVETYAITVDGYTVLGEARTFDHEIGTVPNVNS